MSSVLRIARLEVVDAWRRRALQVLGAVVALLLVASAAAGVARHRAHGAQQARYQALVRAQWDAQPDRHPHRVAHYGYLAFRPPPPLAVLDPGVDRYAGTSIFLEAHRQNTANFGEARHAGGALRFGELSPATVLQLLVPLVVFFAGFAAVTREREQGTLALLLAQGASWRALLAGKTLGLVAVVLLLLLPGVLLAGAVVLLRAGEVAVPDLGARALLLAAAYLAYVVACAAGAVLLSALHRTSRGALLTLVGVWIGLWVVLPRLVPALAAAAHPTPARVEYEAALERDLRRTGDSHDPNDPYFASLRRRWLDSVGVRDVRDLPVNYGGIVMRESEAITARLFASHRARLRGAWRRQDAWSAWAGLASPYLAVRALSMAVAGTDARHAEHFEDAAEAYRYDVVQRLNDLHVTEIGYENDRAQRVGHERWDGFPQFAPAHPPLAWAMAGTRVPLLALAAWTLLVASGGALVARRARVV